MFTKSRLVVFGWLLLWLSALIPLLALMYLQHIQTTDPGIGFGLASMATAVMTIPVVAILFFTGIAILRRTNDDK